MATPPVSIYYTGSWFHKDGAQEAMACLSEAGITLTLDWTSPEHRAKDQITQCTSITEAIKRADVFVVNLEHYEDRVGSASFLQCAIAHSHGVPMVVLDPLKETRKRRAQPDGTPSSGPVRHPAFMNVMGSFLLDESCCTWICDRGCLVEAIRHAAQQARGEA